jgi:hypothetical protein
MSKMCFDSKNKHSLIFKLCAVTLVMLPNILNVDMIQKKIEWVNQKC